MIDFIQTNQEALVQIVLATVALASLIANLTPTESDNKIVAKLSAIVNFLALNFKKKP